MGMLLDIYNWRKSSPISTDCVIDAANKKKRLNNPDLLDNLDRDKLDTEIL